MSTLDEGLGFNEIEQSYWLKAIKLDPWPLDEGLGFNEIEQSYWLKAINWTHGL